MSNRMIALIDWRIDMARISVEAHKVLKTLSNVFKVDVFKLENFVALMVTDSDVAAVAVYQNATLEVHNPETVDDVWKLYHATVAEFKKVTRVSVEELLNTPAKMGCCGVYAVALVAGRNFKETFYDFRETYKKRKTWKGCTSLVQQKEMLDNYGVGYTECENVGRVTLKEFAMVYAEPNKKYLIITTGHAQVLENGVVTDQRGPKPLREFWGNRKTVKNVLEMV